MSALPMYSYPSAPVKSSSAYFCTAATSSQPSLRPTIIGLLAEFLGIFALSYLILLPLTHILPQNMLTPSRLLAIVGVSAIVVWALLGTGEYLSRKVLVHRSRANGPDMETGCYVDEKVVLRLSTEKERMILMELEDEEVYTNTTFTNAVHHPSPPTPVNHLDGIPLIFCGEMDDDMTLMDSFYADARPSAGFASSS